jgi:hypothetical protein
MFTRFDYSPGLVAPALWWFADTVIRALRESPCGIRGMLLGKGVLTLPFEQVARLCGPKRLPWRLKKDLFVACGK